MEQILEITYEIIIDSLGRFESAEIKPEDFSPEEYDEALGEVEERITDPQVQEALANSSESIQDKMSDILEETTKGLESNDREEKLYAAQYVLEAAYSDLELSREETSNNV